MWAGRGEEWEETDAILHSFFQPKYKPRVMIASSANNYVAVRYTARLNQNVVGQKNMLLVEILQHFMPKQLSIVIEMCVILMTMKCGCFDVRIYLNLLVRLNGLFFLVFLLTIMSVSTRHLFSK